MNNEETKFLLEESIDILSKPTYIALEVGFRHSPLTKDEQISRHAESCEIVRQYLLIVHNNLYGENDRKSD